MAANNGNRPDDEPKRKRSARGSEARFFEIGTDEEVSFVNSVNGYRRTSDGGVVARDNIEVRRNGKVIGAAGPRGSVLEGQTPKGVLPRKKDGNGEEESSSDDAAGNGTSEPLSRKDLTEEIKGLEDRLTTALESQQKTADGAVPPQDGRKETNMRSLIVGLAVAGLVLVVVLGLLGIITWNTTGSQQASQQPAPAASWSVAGTNGGSNAVTNEGNGGNQSVVLRREDGQIRRVCIRDPRGDPFCCWGAQPQSRRVTGGMELYCPR